MYESWGSRTLNSWKQLCAQEQAQKFGLPCNIRTACLYGGAPRGPQLGQLRRGIQVAELCGSSQHPKFNAHGSLETREH
eukprot:4282058-Amphidinium_carterae.1